MGEGNSVGTQRGKSEEKSKLRIAEIVANLLENAFKYAQKDAEIGLAITSNGLCIFDDGKKITKNENEKIFQKGYRGSAAKKITVVKGTANLLVISSCSK